MWFADSIDTRSALEAMRELTSNGNSYIIKKRTDATLPDRNLLRNVAQWITRILKVRMVVSIVTGEALSDHRTGRSDLYHSYYPHNFEAAALVNR